MYEEVRVRGLRIPDDLSVVGFDDTEVCEWTAPKLTTIRQPPAQMAVLAVRDVPEGEHPAEEPLRLELSTSLVISGQHGGAVRNFLETALTSRKDGSTLSPNDRSFG